MTPPDDVPRAERGAEDEGRDAAGLDDDGEDGTTPDESSGWGRLRRLAPFIASATSALVVVLAFLLPGVQDQWDRWQSRRVIDAYADVGRQLMSEERYLEAEQAFAKAFELSESRRLDFDVERLEAHVHRLLLEPAWGAPNPVDVTESDFRLLLLLQRREGDGAGEARTQALFADFLAREGRVAEAITSARRAVLLDSTFSRGWVSLGNALEDSSQFRDAIAAYRRAVAVDSMSASAAYDLALLLEREGRFGESRALVQRAAVLAPDDSLVLLALGAQLQRSGDTAGAAAVGRRLTSLRAAAARRRPPPDSATP